MNNKLLTLALITVLAVLSACNRQLATTKTTSGRSIADTLVIMSYNIENYFHCDDDPEKNDDDFTPSGSYAWTFARMNDKAEHLKKVIMAANSGNIGSHPSIVGLCEIEGQAALDYLLAHSGLGKVYDGIVYPTPDKRGIAVAMLYDRLKVKVLSSQNVNVSIADSSFYTRDILYSKLVFDADTFHVMVNHWPSKHSGAESTIWKREYVASKARQLCDSINAAEKGNAKIVLVGDFNDTADAPALVNYLGATKEGSPYINLSSDTQAASYKYRGEWGTIDHVVVSPALCRVARPVFSVCDLDFISEIDERYGGKLPFRTFRRNVYTGGFSDHYPVMVKIIR